MKSFLLELCPAGLDYVWFLFWHVENLVLFICSGIKYPIAEYMEDRTTGSAAEPVKHKAIAD